MELLRQEYPALLESLQPNQAVSVLNDRVRLIGIINADIADWLLERRRVEDAYVQGLKRLAGRRLEGIASLGVFQTSWQSIVSATEILAGSHGVFAQKIEADVEKPLREFQSKSKEMHGISTIQGNLAALARELEDAQKKVEKLRLKGAKADINKVSSALLVVQNASQQWDSQAPFVFEQLQALDESRVNHLRDALTQLQTHDVDQLERSRVSAESALNVLLNVATIDEISAFVAKTTGNAPTLRRDTRPATMEASPAPAPLVVPSAPATSNRPASASTPIPLATPNPTPSQFVDDGRPELSGAPSHSEQLPPPAKARKGGIGGLKRLGTVIGRRKTNSRPSDRPPSPEKQARPSRNPLRRGSSSRNMQQLGSSNNSMTDLPIMPSRLSTADGRESLQSQGRQPSPSPAEQRGSQSEANGDTSMSTLANEFTLPNSSYSNQEIPPERKARPPSTIPEEVDGDGFSVPVSRIDDISRAQEEATAGSDASGFKLDIRNVPIREEDVDAQTALSNVANTLRAQAQALPPQRRTATFRGRRDVRNTIFVPNPADGPPPPDMTTPASPFNYARGILIGQEEYRGSDSQSVRSAHSLASLTQVTVRHHEMIEPGLNASIIETVSAWFANGQVSQAVVIGELALSHNGPDTSPNAVRLENFPVLEKVAPNPAFVNQVPSKPGEYTLDTSQISRMSVAFKYKVHLEDANVAMYAPFILTPVWKVEPSQASVIVHFSFNPLFASPQRRVHLQNTVIMINIENAKALSCQSKPLGHFSKEKNLIYWKLGDVTLEENGASPHRLLARFTTDAEAKPGNVEARWEIGGEQAAGMGSGLGLTQASVPMEGGADPFADEGVAGLVSGLYKEVAMTRKMVSGKYVAM